MPILICYLVTMFIRPQDWVPWFLGFPTASVLIPLGLIWGYSIYSADENRIALPQSKLLIGYLLVIFVSTFVGTDFGNAVDVFIVYLKRVLVFFMFYWLITSKEQLKVIVGVILALTLFVVYQANLQVVYGEAWGGLKPYVDSVSQRSLWWGDWDGPNVVSIMFLVSVPFALEWVWGNVAVGKRLFGLFLACMLFLGIIHTNSRGAMLTVVVVLLFNYRARLLNPKIMILTVIVGSLLLAVAPSRVSKISSKEDSASERIWLWEQGLKFFRANPVLGLGKDQFAKRADLRLRAHSNYVQNIAELGITGFAFYIALLWMTYKGNLRVLSFGMRSHKSILALNRAMLNAVVAFATVTFFVTFELDFFYMVLGVCAAAYSIACKENNDIPKPDFTKRDIIVIGSGMFAIYCAIWLAAIAELL